MKQTSKILLCSLFAAATALAASHVCPAMDGPDTVQIGAIANLFAPVNFDHALHTGVTDTCATCHHHTTGTGVVDQACMPCHKNSGPAAEVSCQGCHQAKRFEAAYIKELESDATRFHRDKVGLKAAYHLRCMGCHEESGAPTGCQDCHPRNETGDKFYHAGPFAPPPGGKKNTAHH